VRQLPPVPNLRHIEQYCFSGTGLLTFGFVCSVEALELSAFSGCMKFEGVLWLLPVRMPTI
jgi:hypothetical protein